MWRPRSRRPRPHGRPNSRRSSGLAKLPPEERAKAEGEAQAQELTKLRTELLQRDLKDAAVKKLTDEGFPVGLADLLTYTDKESMEKSLQQTRRYSRARWRPL